MRCFWFVVLVGCSTAARGLPGDDTNNSDAAADGAIIGDSAVTGCAPPTPFITETLPKPGASSSRRHAVLQSLAGAMPRVLAADSGTGFTALVEITKGTSSWTEGGSTTDDDSFSFNDLVATGGPAAAIAYSDRMHRVHIQSAALGDRIVAPSIMGGPGATLALGHAAAAEQMIYFTQAQDFVWTPYTTSPGTSETIASGMWIGPTSIVIDNTGAPHVAYVASEGAVRHIMYATRTMNGWTTLPILDDTGGNTTETDAISIVLASGVPTIALFHHATRSLDLARLVAGAFVVTPLVTPPVGFASDAAGESVVLAVGCNESVHVVYRRHFTTDAVPSQLVYGQLTGNAITEEFLPTSSNTASIQPHGLAFIIMPDGHEVVAAEYGNAGATYYAAR